MLRETALFCFAFPYCFFKPHSKALRLTVLWFSSCLRNLCLYYVNAGTAQLLLFFIPLGKLYILVLHFKLSSKILKENITLLSIYFL